MRVLAKPTKLNEEQGFTLARVGWFSYNPVDFNLLRENAAGIADAGLNGQPKKR